ncbi:PHP domain-containing protein [Spectribacter hydrogenoxidans]|uniref:PHP domain-containing protein n=1 Tax=Spectribacter hydrogenoxidans TaxID=3075608 RepID=A0ABU3C3R1_9GAMM|nr:PHP domain-containing protein [Salinisphaera sp. W335]MDT0636191.1 PHP domain-containing protein [Salinisphaera sp. W335]
MSTADCREPARIDLHTHSTASDGTLTPAALVQAAHAGGVRALALTDHDTADGLGEANIAAAELHLRLVPGVEISVTWEKRTLHIVGLGFDAAHPGLRDLLADLQQCRAARTDAMLERLDRIGVARARERIEVLAAGGQITRAHFARLLIEDGRCQTTKQCFKRFLNPGKPAYVNATWAGLQETVSHIHQAGGVAVLAHPLAYNMTGAWRRRMLDAFQAAGGRAMEVVCGNSTPNGIAQMAEAATGRGLLGSVGSDFHSPDQRWLRLGRPLTLPAAVAPVWDDPALARWFSEARDISR